ncbi:hypothetical protein ACWIWA_00560 [Ursidibacter arcticus]
MLNLLAFLLGGVMGKSATILSITPKNNAVTKYPKNPTAYF